jgi:hypothetical protein
MIALPDALRFLGSGWWLVHLMAFLIAYQYGYNRGRGEERRRQRSREIEKPKA